MLEGNASTPQAALSGYRINNNAIYVVFTASIFLSAGLLFMVQPMFGKMALPLLGGTPGVWNTAMVFFQASLLAGYCYAHVLGKLPSTRLQQGVHLIIMAAATAVLPLSIGAGWQSPPEGTPTLWLLGLLAANVGAPFFALSANAPLIQKWFSKTAHPHASDPYFLYAASNLGSFIGLLSYPFLIEPALTVSTQTLNWFGGYVALMVLLLGATVLTAHTKLQTAPMHAAETEAAAPVTWAQRSRWIFWSALPSAMLLSVTTHITTDVVAMPLLWVIPLSLYLLTFALVFAKRALVSSTMMLELQPFFVIAALITMNVLRGIPVIALGLIAIGAFFTTTMISHRRLAEARPDSKHLTEFYLFMSLGGVIGGALVALVAPVVFNDLYEYPALLVLGLMIRPLQESRSRIDLYAPACIALVTIAGDVVFEIYGLTQGVTLGIILLFVFSIIAPKPSTLRLVLLSCAAILLATLSSYWTGMPQTVHKARSFFGVIEVSETQDNAFRELMHGTTLHGMQALDEDRRKEPFLYYDRQAGGGRLIAAMQSENRLKNIGLIGLGAGALACYAQPDQNWTVFEIDQHVIDISTGDGLFTYMQSCAPSAAVVVGDGRLTLAKEEDGHFDLLLFDAFSSDSIPMHLMTKEALSLYLDKLSETGVLAFHISNRYLDPEPALTALAADAGLSIRAFDFRVDGEPKSRERTNSNWVVMSKDHAFIEGLQPRQEGAQTGNVWRPARAKEGMALWTDDYSNIFEILK
ncbi:MAG: fused MFS/spermidine synthase [Pseudomonadota bacterium]